MITFLASFVILIFGYLIYGTFIEKVFGADEKKATPATTKADGVDYVVMKPWRIFLVQFLNIAGLGPIFGAIMGIFYGPSAFLWIVFGSIFAGGVHDYLSGMLSIRSGGLSLPDIVGNQLGSGIKTFMRILTVVLLLLLTTSFLGGVSVLLQGLLPLPTMQLGQAIRPMAWLIIVFLYFTLATVLPIDKVIGRIYPIFGIILLFMGAAIMFAMFKYHAGDMPEIFDGLHNRQTGNMPLFPMMFVSIACGAISGFHGTQSPLMARCVENERYGRITFYGAMIVEGMLALVWAAAAGTFFADPDKGLYGIDGLRAFAAQHPGQNVAALVVDTICRSWVGKIGGLLAIIGVVAAPITSGDTALRSARLVIADALNFNQKKIWHRLVVAFPLFLIVGGVSFLDFNSVWRYFSWTNQVLATFTLWAGAWYLYKQETSVPNAKYRFGYLTAFLPAVFMTMVSVSYIFIAPEGFDFATNGIEFVSYIIAAFVTHICLMIFYGDIIFKGLRKS